MYTLVQLLTLDSWNGIVRQIVKWISWSWMYFYCYIAIAVVVLMNLVTAIMVENALSNSKTDEDKQLSVKERQKQLEIKKLNQLFMLMDDNGDGTLSWEEFKEAFENPIVSNKWKLLDYEPEECKELFRLLDPGNGMIPITDFFDGLHRMKGTAQSKDVFRIMKRLEDLAEVVTCLTEGASPGIPKHQGTTTLSCSRVLPKVSRAC